MGTRGYRVIRFRNRYYRFYNNYDSYPEGLGRELVTEIPKDPAAYQEWLAQQREQALQWHNDLERFLCRDKANANADALDETVADQDEGGEQQQSWGVATDSLPDFKPALNDLYIEWVYTIDLDNEVFTIDNGAHIQLSWAPRVNWIPALAMGYYGDKILLPHGIQEEAIADIVLKLPAPSASVLDTYGNLDVQIVQAKGLDGFPPSYRHGPLFRSRIFYFFRDIYEPILAAVLLSWRSEDLVFRDIAYAVLSLASADLYPSVISGLHVVQNRGMPLAALKKEGESSEQGELINDLGAGSHSSNELHGSSPDSEMYWFGAVLVHLVVQLIDWPEILNAAIVSVVEFCQKERPNQRVDAILMSIEHVVLMTIESDGRVQRTEPLTLFDIQIHTSMNASERYDEGELEKLQKSKKKAIRKREIKDLEYRRRFANPDDKSIQEGLEKLSLETAESDEEEGSHNVDEQTSWPAAGLRQPRVKKAEAGFFALAFFLEASSRRYLPTQRGVFPAELYRTILLNNEDVETYRACMQVSRTFRDICQEDILITNKFRFQANEASKTYQPGSESFPALRMQNLSSDRSHDVTVKRIGGGFALFEMPRHPRDTWRFVVGRDSNRRSLVSSLAVAFDEVK